MESVDDNNSHTTETTTTTTTTTEKEPASVAATATTPATAASSGAGVGGGDGGGGGGSWWSSLVKTAKEKSANAIEIMRTDLAEFKSTMSADTTRLVTSLTATAENVDAATTSTTGNLLNSLSSLGEALGINTIISGMVGDEESAGEGAAAGADGGSVADKRPGRVVVSPPGNVHERFQAELKQMQADEATYLADLASPADFDAWAKSFNPDEVKSAISDLLIDNSAMRLIYSQLVPAQMSNNQFWSRYFFKYNQLEEDYKKRVQLLEKASKSEKSKEEEDTNNDWDDEDTPNSPKSDKQTEKATDRTTSTDAAAAATATTHEQENAKTTVSASKSTEESDDWEKLSDFKEQVDQKPSSTGENVKSEEKPDSTVASAAVEATSVADAESDSSKLSEVEVPRSSHQKNADNDWEDWDE